MRHEAKKVKTAGFQMFQCKSGHTSRLIVSETEVVHILILVLLYLLDDLISLLYVMSV